VIRLKSLSIAVTVTAAVSIAVGYVAYAGLTHNFLLGLLFRLVLLLPSALMGFLAALVVIGLIFDYSTVIDKLEDKFDFHLDEDDFLPVAVIGSGIVSVIAAIIAVFFAPVAGFVYYGVFAALGIVGAVHFHKTDKIPQYSKYSNRKPAKVQKHKSTGNEALDEALSAIFSARKEFDGFSAAIRAAKIRQPLSRVTGLLDEITENIRQNPDNVRKIRELISHYLPTIVRQLKTYERLSAKTNKVENITKTLSKIEEFMNEMPKVFERVFNELFEGLMEDVSADLAVMKTIIKT
jgi:5-bromo-4-chloroindolyl phosphate hydrolysis protein